MRQPVQSIGRDSIKRRAFYGPTLLRVVEGSGSFMNLLSVQLPGQEIAVSQAPVSLIPPFAESMAHDGSVRVCRLAEPDDWRGALDLLNTQVGLAGFRVTYTSAVKSGVSDRGVTLYIRKRVCCVRSGQPRQKPDGTQWVGCPVFGWLLNVTAPSDDIPGITVQPGIYMQRVGELAHNHEAHMAPQANQDVRPSHAAGRCGRLKRAMRDGHGGRGPPAKSCIRAATDNVTCQTCAELRLACLHPYPCRYCVENSLTCLPHGNGNGKYSGRVYAELVIEHLDLRGLAGLYLQAFYAALQRGKLDYDVMLLDMRRYRKLSIAAQTDITYGAMDVVCRELGISMLDLEDRSELLNDRAVGKEMCQMVKTEGIDFIRETDQFKRAERAGKAVSVSVWTADEGYLFMSEAHRELVFSSKEMRNYLQTLKMPSFYLAAAMLVPEDRYSMFENYILYACKGASRRYSAFVKIVDREGDIGLYHMVMEDIACEGLPVTKGMRSVIFTFEKMPDSRYFTTRPGTSRRPLTVVGGEVDRVRLPAIACIPLPPPPLGSVELPLHSHKHNHSHSHSHLARAAGASADVGLPSGRRADASGRGSAVVGRDMGRGAEPGVEDVAMAAAMDGEVLDILLQLTPPASPSRPPRALDASARGANASPAVSPLGDALVTGPDQLDAVVAKAGAEALLLPSQPQPTHLPPSQPQQPHHHLQTGAGAGGGEEETLASQGSSVGSPHQPMPSDGYVCRARSGSFEEWDEDVIGNLMGFTPSDSPLHEGFDCP